MIFVLYTIHVLICIFLILVVLLQQGSGADLSVFGGGGTQTAFGARSATNLLHRLTVAAFVGFIVTTITIGLYKLGAEQGGVMSGVDASPAAAVEDNGADEATDEIPEDAAPAIEVPAASEDTPAAGDESTPAETDGDGSDGA